MNIRDRHIGPAALQSPAGLGVYIIAELGVNHDGQLARALDLVEGAAAAGVDAIKLQLFETDRLMSASAKLAAYQRAAGESDPIAMLRRLELPLNQMHQVITAAHARGLHAIVTCFSTELVAAAHALPWDAYKTASPDIIHRPLLDALVRTGRPLIISTGAATLPEIARALTWLAPARDRLAVLQCVSSYPTSRNMAQLGGIGAIAQVFAGPIGYSDHTPDEDTGALAVRAGAVILEKHLTYNCQAKGPDHRASLEPAQMRRYVDLARRAAEHRRADGVRPCSPAIKRVLEVEQDVRLVSRQSLVAVRSLPVGHVLVPDDVAIKRPGNGIPPWARASAFGHPLLRPVNADHVISWTDLGLNASEDM